ncbi:MAG: hypothetical protein KVP17_004211 [Porospora cf. gigantea B]|uniref:uncharacterized protein n=1 Tax=Porospora cf. gigantea B TaxID=2853592 RepID=UPI003571C515|nr:MAG: hypothetical protein KVP17_004211 [Porospora cf. gigantea B]
MQPDRPDIGPPLPSADIPQPQAHHDIQQLRSWPFPDGPVVSEARDQRGSAALEIFSRTWTRDSHDLFDYEANAEHMKIQKFYVPRSAKVYRIEELVHVAAGDSFRLPDRSDWLCGIKYREHDNRYVIQPAERTQVSMTFNPKRLWLIVREIPGAVYRLQKGDLIKLGRYKLRVRQLVREGDPQMPEFSVEESEMSSPVLAEEEALTIQCRICLLEGSTREDPLICPCTCKGSIKYVHVDCLRRWVSGQLNISVSPWKEPNQTGTHDIFFYKSVPCELCKTTYPSHVTVGTDRLSIARVPLLTPPFILLENVVGQTHSGGTYVCPMSERKVLRLGRGHDSEVRIPDVSISRTHATVTFEDGEFFLRDNQSKFGTLVSMKKPFFVDPDCGLQPAP